MKRKTRRRKLPAPPLVLQPHFARIPSDSSKAERLLALGRFLAQHGLLTDGGVKSLDNGLRGRNDVRSLGLQDVRSWAHGLVVELWLAEPQEWMTLFEDYRRRFDKGKPRRPNALQRLYLEWSPDYSWPGLLDACRVHGFLWERLDEALARLHDDHPERPLLSLASQCRTNMTAWDDAWRQGVTDPSVLLQLLFKVSRHDERLPRLSAIAASVRLDEELPSWAYFVIAACCCSFDEARTTRPSVCLEDLARSVLDAFDGMHQAEFLCGFRAFLSREDTLQKLMAGLSPADPLQRVTYGARPGIRWIESLREELEQLIALRSSSSL